jgi:hypothetical protein
MTSSCAPVVLFAYARPDHLRRTLSALSSAEGAQETTLWVFSDGPKNENAVENVAAVRALLAEPSWRAGFASVKVFESVTNKGLARSIIDGVSRVMAVEGRVIVLEDDLLVAPGFLAFMNAALERHRDSARVGSVTGYCPLAVTPQGYPYALYAVPRSCSHSWATWADRWERVDWSGREAARLWQDRKLRARFEATGTDKLDRLRRQLEGRIDSWSILFNLWHVLDERVALYPVRNLVHNIGFDGSGTHTGAQSSLPTALQALPLGADLALPPEDGAVLAAFRQVYSGGLPGRIRRFLRNMILPEAMRRAQGREGAT